MIGHIYGKRKVNEAVKDFLSVMRSRTAGNTATSWTNVAVNLVRKDSN